MKISWAMMSVCMWAGMGVGAAQAQSMTETFNPDYYVGAGLRVGLNDSAALVIDSKAKLADWGDLTFSARPAAFVGDEFELRLPLTIEGSVSETVYPYAGAGLAYNTDGLSAVDPMVTAGVDLGIGRNLVLDLNLNVIFQTAISDTDAEFIATLNYVF